MGKNIDDILKGVDIISEDIDFCIEYFNKNHTSSDLARYFRFFSLSNGKANERQILKIMTIINSFLMIKDLSVEQRAFILNNKTCMALMLDNKYEALDAAFECRNLKCNSFNEQYLNSNYIFNIYFSQELFNEALTELLTAEKRFADNLNEYTKYILYLNTMLVYAKLDDYEGSKRYDILCRKVAEKLSSDIFMLSYKVFRISSHALLYPTHKEKINIYEDIRSYILLLTTYRTRFEEMFDTVDTHVDIINLMINLKMYQEVEEVCFSLLEPARTASYKVEIYKCLKNAYERIDHPNLMDILKLYIYNLEDVKRKEKDFYKNYFIQMFNLYEISNNYYDLLKNYEHDDLTQCYSRGVLMQLVQSNTIIDGALIYLDLNNLKIVNDTNAHLIGDEYLRNFGALLSQTFDGIGEPYRIGGDEFVVIIHTHDKEEIIKYLEKLNENTLSYRDDSIYLDYKFSSGIAFFDPSDSFEVVLNNADTAMYECKKDPDSFYKFFE